MNSAFKSLASTPSLLQVQTFGFSSFRKRLGMYSFKLTKNRKFKNPHAMSLRKRQDLQKEGYKGLLKIKETERLSERPFGHHTKKGKFIFDIDRVPFFNIPDLHGFQVSNFQFISNAISLVKTLCFIFDSSYRPFYQS